MSSAEPFFLCPKCRGRTYLPADIAAHYCPCCGGPGLPHACPHTAYPIGVRIVGAFDPETMTRETFVAYLIHAFTVQLNEQLDEIEAHVTAWRTM